MIFVLSWIYFCTNTIRNLSSLYKSQAYPEKSEEMAVYICIIGNLEQLVCSYGRLSVLWSSLCIMVVSLYYAYGRVSVL